MTESVTVEATDLQPLDVFADGMGSDVMVKETEIVGDYVDVTGEDLDDGETVTYRFRSSLRVDVEREV